jgi:hypothetical protein
MKTPSEFSDGVLVSRMMQQIILRCRWWFAQGGKIFWLGRYLSKA